MLRWNRDRVLPGLLVLAGLTWTATAAEDPPKPPVESPPKELQVSPAAAPVPALRYRLLPLESELNPGDAAPIYLRMGAEQTDAAIHQIQENSSAWMELPLDKFPTAEARKFVNGWGNRLQQMDYAGRRQTCDWNYTLPEQRENAIEILLPDAQEMRNWARLLAIKARVEVAEHKYDDAVRTIETGLAFGRHVAEGPFLINSLVGVAIASVMSERLEELIAQPDAPNLYWALTALPRPLIDLRAPMANEMKMGEWIIPEIADPDRRRTEAEWASTLERLHARMIGMAKLMDTPEGGNPEVRALKDVDLAKFKAEVLPEAKKYVAEHHLADQTVEMSDEQAIVVYLALRYRELRDDTFKGFYLPFPEVQAIFAATEEHLKAAKVGPLAIFAEIQPAVRHVLLAQTRLDRRVAALRVFEALRMHAATNNGQWPDALDQLTIVPIPFDPISGKPFEYHREGETAVLIGPPLQYPKSGISYRLTLRK